MRTSFGTASVEGVERLLCGSAISLVLALGAGGASAQDGAEPTRLGPVSVEGEAPAYKAEPKSPKYTAPLVDTPRSITVLTEEILQETAATTFTEALRMVPGISMAMGEGGQPFADRPFIRGYESTSGILLDGMRDSSAQSRDVFNIAQVEVAKGSSGMFAGRGAPGGSINLVTKRASAENFINSSFLYGNADQKRATVDVNHALTDSIAARLNVMWHDAGIPGRDEVYDNRWGIAPTLAAGLDGPTRFTGSYTHYESDGIIDYGHPQDPATGKPVTGIDPDTFYGLIDRDFHDTKLDTGFVEIEHDFNESISVRNITRYTRNFNAYIASNPDDSHGNIVNDLVARVVKSNNSVNKTFVNQTDLMALFETGGLAHSVSAGIEYSDERTRRATYSVDQTAPGGVAIPRGGCDQFGAGAPSNYNCTSLFNPNPLDPWQGAISLNTPTITKAETVGLYLFDTVTINEQWLVNVGVRWDDFSTNTSAGLSSDNDFVTYQAGVVFKPARNGSIYASIGTSASPSGVTAGDGAENISTGNENLEPERGRNYELGTKWELFDNDLSVNAALFRTEIVNDHVAIAPGRGAPQEAIGKQRVQGIELTISGRVTPQWDILAGYSYLDSEIVDAGPVNTAIVGNRMPNTPEHSFNMWTSYEFTPAFTLGGGATYVSERFGDTANARSVNGYWRFDAMASYDISENIDVQVNVQNLTDKRYYERVYTTHMATVATGRSVTGRVNLSF